MKKIICLIVMCICLAGCADGNSTEPKDEVTYSYEDVDGVITYIDVRRYFAYVPRWQWEIKVEYDEKIAKLKEWKGMPFKIEKRGGRDEE